MSRFLKVLADATEDNSKLGAGAIGVAHRTHRGLLDAAGINIPNPVKNLTDSIYRTNQKIVLGAGHKTAEALRKLDETLHGESHGEGSDHQSDDESEQDDEDDEGSGTDEAVHRTEPHHDRVDSRDHQFEYISEKVHVPSVDLRDSCPLVYNQKQMGSCTAHAVAGAFEFDVMKQGLPHFSPSRLFIWYNARAKSHVPQAVKKNVGSSMREAIQSLDLKAHGVCSEDDWPYEVGKFDLKTLFFHPHARAAQKPPVIVENHAHLHTACRYFAFKGPDLRRKLCQCLHDGYPFVFVMKTYGLLNKIDSNGRGLKLPKAKDKKKGDHAHSIMAVGYIEEEQVFIIRNSWGAHWGLHGHFYMPYKYLQYCHDFWTIRVVHSKPAHGHASTSKHKGRK